ncbi:hypothetical protein PIB30_047478, partial [Stylosanthes scabra]|nr:hypothetical protein [Stylosanthes scabra]
MEVVKNGERNGKIIKKAWKPTLGMATGTHGGGDMPPRSPPRTPISALRPRLIPVVGNGDPILPSGDTDIRG